MANLIMFIILAAVILGSAVMCVVTTRIMRAATFMLFVLFGVAGRVIFPVLMHFCAARPKGFLVGAKLRY